MRQLVLYSVFFLLTLPAFSQWKPNSSLILKCDFSAFTEFPVSIIVEKKSLGDYETKTDTCKITGNQFSYKSILLEPEFLKVIFCWRSGKKMLKPFMAFPLTYQIDIDRDLKPSVRDSVDLNFAREFMDIEDEILSYRKRSDSLTNNVSYENKEIKDVEERIEFIKDSVEKLIDENVYKRFVFSHLNTPAGLYALCKYADRPIEDQRRKSKPDLIKKMFDSLNINIRNLPTGRMLSRKLELTKKLEKGKTLKDVLLYDTAGVPTRINDFKGKYLLVEFWASWCIPCRLESPGLIKVYNKYKDKGFQIVGITLDELFLKRMWLKAIKDDDVGSWPQLRDYDKLAQNTYDISLIPANFLLDKEGVIVGKNLRGAALEKALTAIFHE